MTFWPEISPCWCFISVFTTLPCHFACQHSFAMLCQLDYIRFCSFSNPFLARVAAQHICFFYFFGVIRMLVYLRYSEHQMNLGDGKKCNVCIDICESANKARGQRVQKLITKIDSYKDGMFRKESDNHVVKGVLTTFETHAPSFYRTRIQTKFCPKSVREKYKENRTPHARAYEKRRQHTRALKRWQIQCKGMDKSKIKFGCNFHHAMMLAGTTALIRITALRITRFQRCALFSFSLQIRQFHTHRIAACVYCA